MKIQPIDGHDNGNYYVAFVKKTLVPKIDVVQRYFHQSYRKNKVAFVVSNM